MRRLLFRVQNYRAVFLCKDGFFLESKRGKYRIE